MRYLIDAEHRRSEGKPPKSVGFPYAVALRSEIGSRNVDWAVESGHVHEVSLGSIPSVLYREDERGRHGNFLPDSYREILLNPDWKRRLNKIHTTARRALLSGDQHRCELDSSNSSDALLMNIFCHPETLASRDFRGLLGVDEGCDLIFGYRPHAPLLSGRFDRTDVDLKIGNLLIEAKLTERDFQNAPLRLVAQYAHVEEVFRIDELLNIDGSVTSYQLVRNVLAANITPENRFCVMCDLRRPDLVDAWHRVMAAVKPYDLRCRLQLVTWQEAAAALSPPLQVFLKDKYGISAAGN